MKFKTTYLFSIGIYSSGIYQWVFRISDLVYAYNKLLPPTKYAKQLGEKSQLTSSSISFYWGLKRKVDELHAHNIFTAENYRASFDDIFKKYTLPDDPCFYVHVPTRVDPSCNDSSAF